MKRLGKLRSIFFFVTLAGLDALCQTQQNATCQAQDYANVGAEIAATTTKIQLATGSSGLSKDAIQSFPGSCSFAAADGKIARWSLSIGI